VGGGDGGGWPADRSPGDGAGPDGPRLPPIAWLPVSPSTFIMGSPLSEKCRLSNEVQHKVKLTHAFQLAKHEVTQSQYLAVNKENPSKFTSCGPGCPVERVSWSDAAVFCNNMSKIAGLERCYVCTGQGDSYTKPHDCKVRVPYDGSGGNKTIYDCPGYRLPTEAEWEYAYRAGTQTPLYNGIIGGCFSDGRVGSIAWYAENSGSTTHPVGKKAPNKLGLHDMAGNVWEWVDDWYTSNLGPADATDPTGPASGVNKVLRGGSWLTSAGSARAAQRNQNARSKTFEFVGFRVARTLK
jgi:formylglycine-generating enzyme required for sulfatase activity